MNYLQNKMKCVLNMTFGALYVGGIISRCMRVIQFRFTKQMIQPLSNK